MSNAKKGRPAQKPKRTQKWVALTVALLVIIIGSVTVVHFWKTGGINSANTQPNLPDSSAYTDFINQYLAIMQNLNSSQDKTLMAAQLNPSYNQTDLFAWEHSKLIFNESTAGFYYDPFQILADGKGICMQWSIVYVSACLALGYQSRLVVAVNTSTWTFIHTWAEDYVNGSWVHVDPSDSVWNDPSRYQSWGWGTFGTDVKVYAFEDGSYQDVTATYAPHSS